jgi:hypothetical protein
MYEQILDLIAREESYVPTNEQVGIDRLSAIAAEINNYLVTEAEDGLEEGQVLAQGAGSRRLRQDVMTLYYYLRTGRVVFATPR